ncbi:hypothetical protein PS15p_206645 [Mucor circinelloides]
MDQGYLQQLQYIPDVEYRFNRFKQNDIYGSVALALKSTLNCLIITTPRPRKLKKPSPNTSEINLLQHLQGFPWLKRLSVPTLANELLLETLMYIHKCADVLKNLELELANSQAASQKPIRSMLALNKLSKKPNTKTLKIKTCVITTEDLQCVQYMFNGLQHLSIEIWNVTRYGSLSSSTYIDAFNYVVPIKSFELHNLPVVSGAIEMLAYWSKFPQVNTIDIVESGIKELDVLLLTVNNTMQPKGYFDEDKEDGGWIVKLDTYYRDFNIFYQQALEQFSGSAIEYISLHALAPWET